MSSTLTVNFSLRQNKAIERSIAFDALQEGQRFIGDNAVYIGFGSVWFQDFRIAHRQLRLDRMISIEGNPNVVARAKFNSPYRCVEVRDGWSTEVIPALLDDPELVQRSWIVWLDYDSHLTPERLEELVGLVERLPSRSALLTTFNAYEKKYGDDRGARRVALEELFGPEVLGDVEDPDAFDGDGLMRTLARCLQDRLVSTAINSGRAGGFHPAIRLLYRDSAEMVTVGGFLPDSEDIEECHALVNEPDWFGFDDLVIRSQPLTLREVYALTQLLPADGELSAEAVEGLGFSLPDEQLHFFQRHYHRYPTYAEVV